MGKMHFGMMRPRDMARLLHATGSVAQAARPDEEVRHFAAPRRFRRRFADDLHARRVAALLSLRLSDAFHARDGSRLRRVCR